MNEPQGRRPGSPALFKRSIALSLRRWRIEAGLGQKDAARRIGRTIQHISNLETSRLPSASDLELLLALYGKEQDIPLMRELLDAARQTRNWWADVSTTTPTWFEQFLGLEAGATRLSSFDTVAVPGLLQTRDYAAAVVGGHPDLVAAQVEELVELRLGRRWILDRKSDPVTVSTIIDEAVLHRVRGDRTVMREQLEHLLAMAERPAIDVRILPFTAAATPAQDGGAFVVMDFPPELRGDPGIAYVELLTGGQYVDKPDEIDEYRRALDRLRALAADRDASRGIIEKAMTELR